MQLSKNLNGGNNSENHSWYQQRNTYLKSEFVNVKLQRRIFPSLSMFNDDIINSVLDFFYNVARILFFDFGKQELIHSND